MTNIAYISLAYKAVVMQLMLGEANYCSQQLHLPTPKPIQIENIVSSCVIPPGLGFGGSLETTNFEFCIGKEGKLWRLVKIEDGYVYLSSDKIVELSKTKPKSLIDEEGAYQLSKKWLSAISVDVPRLEKKNSHNVMQLYVCSPGTTNKTMIPAYVVSWGNSNSPLAEVKVLGSTKELMEIVINDVSFSTRPALVVTNAAQLNSGPPPLRKMNTNNEPDRLIPNRRLKGPPSEK